MMVLALGQGLRKRKEGGGRGNVFGGRVMDGATERGGQVRKRGDRAEVACTSSIPPYIAQLQ